MFTKARNLAIAALLCAPLMAQAANLPTPSIANSPGVSIHFTRGNTQDLDMMAAAGIKVVRTDFQWSSIENRKGVYDWSAYDELVSNLSKRGMRAYFIMDTSNSLYEQVHFVVQNGALNAYIDSPDSPSSVAAFAAWAKAAAIRYQSKNVIWEIWNEPNNATFWKLTPNVADYITLAKATCNAIHGAVPSAAVIAGATSGIDWNFLQSIIGSGILDCLDGISVHPYRGALPETVTGEYQYLAWLIDQSAPANRKGMIPIIDSEWGYTSVANGLSQDDQANFLVRTQLINLFNNIPISIWYDWKNDGTDASAVEQNFGMVTSTLDPKPGYQALKTMTTQLLGYRVAQHVPTNNPSDCILLFVNDAGKYKMVAWTGSPHAATLLNGFSASAVIPVTSVSGTTQNISMGWSGINMPLTAAPQYLDLKNLPLAAP